MKYLYSVVVTILFFLLPSTLYLLSRTLIKFEYDSVPKVLESIKWVYLGIYLIMFLIILFLFVKKSEIKTINILVDYKKLISSVCLVYLVRILINPILSPSDGEVHTNLPDNISLTLLVLNFLNFVIFPSINEEFVFRGYILKKFINSKRELVTGIIFSSILFASIHINLVEINFRYIIYIFCLGLVFGLIYIRFGIVLSIISHAVINFIFYAQKYLSIDLIVVNYFDNGLFYWLINAIASITTIMLLYDWFKQFSNIPFGVGPGSYIE